MLKWSIWDHNNSNLEYHEDDRGFIKDIFYKKNINHVAIIDSNAFALRGDHFHKETIQHIQILSGGLEYWYKQNKSKESAKFINVYEGDVVTTPPLEIHALKIHKNGCRFLAYSEGQRGGKDYESDTFRVTPSIIG